MIFAYLDPGSGSLLLQALLGGIAGIAVAFKAWRMRLAARVRRSEKEGVASDDQSALSPE